MKNKTINVHNLRQPISKEIYNQALADFKEGKTTMYCFKKYFSELSYGKVYVIRKDMIKRGLLKKDLKMSKSWITRREKKNVLAKPIVENVINAKSIIIDFKGVLIEVEKNPKIFITENKIVIV